MTRLSMAAVAAIVAATSLPAAAQFQKPEDAIKYRQSAFTVMANHFGRVAGMAQGRIPFDAAAAQANMVIVSDLAKLPFTAFGDGTDKGMPNRAKPEIWKEAAKFKAAVGAVGGTCKACHDDFRAEKYN